MGEISCCLYLKEVCLERWLGRGLVFGRCLSTVGTKSFESFESKRELLGTKDNGNNMSFGDTCLPTLAVDNEYVVFEEDREGERENEVADAVDITNENASVEGGEYVVEGVANLDTEVSLKSNDDEGEGEGEDEVAADPNTANEYGDTSKDEHDPLDGERECDADGVANCYGDITKDEHPSVDGEIEYDADGIAKCSADLTKDEHDSAEGVEGEREYGADGVAKSSGDITKDEHDSVEGKGEYDADGVPKGGMGMKGTLNFLVFRPDAILFAADGITWNQKGGISYYNDRKIGTLGNGRIMYMACGHLNYIEELIDMLSDHEDPGNLTSEECAKLCQQYMLEERSKKSNDIDFSFLFGCHSSSEGGKVFSYFGPTNSVLEHKIEEDDQMLVLAVGHASKLANQWADHLTDIFMDHYKLEELSLEQEVSLLKATIWGTSFTSRDADMIGGHILITQSTTEGVKVLDQGCYEGMVFDPWLKEQAKILARKFLKSEFKDGKYEPIDDDEFLRG